MMAAYRVPRCDKPEPYDIHQLELAIAKARQPARGLWRTLVDEAELYLKAVGAAGDIEFAARRLDRALADVVDDEDEIPERPGRRITDVR